MKNGKSALTREQKLWAVARSRELLLRDFAAQDITELMIAQRTAQILGRVLPEVVRFMDTDMTDKERADRHLGPRPTRFVPVPVTRHDSQLDTKSPIDAGNDPSLRAE